MMQKMLMPLHCECCGNDYYEVGYWGDSHYCILCSVSMRRQEEEQRKELARQAAETAEKLGLNLDQYANELPEEIRALLNPRNAGRKAVKYRQEYCEMLIAEAAEGKTESEFAAEIGISQGLISEWSEKRERFRVSREIANELRQAWFERTFRDAMAAKIPCVPNMMIRYGAAKFGWGDKAETVHSGGGEIPVVKLVLHDTGFPTETKEPSAAQAAEAGL